jgi:ABC-type polysaccharide/polyol phosphate export permease
MKSFTYQSDLILNLARRNFILAYKGSTLGILWSALLPLCQMLVLVFVFRKILPLGIEDFPAFLFAALLPWNWFGTSINSASNIFLGNRDLMTRPNFAPQMLMVVDALTNLLTFLISLPILFALLTLHGRGMTISLLFFPLLVLIQGILIVGLGLIIATLNVFYRDVAHIANVAIMLLFWFTPVFYQAETVPKEYRFLFTWNPMAVLVESYRAVFFGTPLEWSSLLLSSILSVMLCGLGYIIYQRQLHDIIDAI